MKRWFIRIFLFLLFGAIVNVAVAWAIALGDSSQPGRRSWQGNGANYPDYLEAQDVRFSSGWGPGRARARCSWLGDRANVDSSFAWVDNVPPLDVLAPAWARAALPKSTDSSTGWYERVIDLRGWPYWSVEAAYECVVETPISVWSPRERVVFAIRLPDRDTRANDSGSPRMLPLRPVWPGFAINTVFYAVILWLLFAGPFVVRRWRRIRRGVCPKCAYDLRGTPEATACPECGAAVTPHPPIR